MKRPGNILFALQLEFIQYLHKARNPFLDPLIKSLDFFDRQEFLFILIPMIWLGCGWKFGMRIFYLLSLSHIVNHGLKNIFSLPRPFHLDPTVGIIQVGGYGFPSGAAQSAILLSGLLLIHWKSRWKWAIAITYLLLVSFSRIYLGVHFPMDIAGGWIVGTALLGIYLFVFPTIEKFFERQSPLNAFIISYCLLTIMMFWLPSIPVISICACAMGLGVGVFINKLTNVSYVPKTKLEFWIQIPIAIIGVFSIYGFAAKIVHSQSFVSLFFLFISIGLWISLGTLYLCKRLSVLWAKENGN